MVKKKNLFLQQQTLLVLSRTFLLPLKESYRLHSTKSCLCIQCYKNLQFFVTGHLAINQSNISDIRLLRVACYMHKIDARPGVCYSGIMPFYVNKLPKRPRRLAKNFQLLKVIAPSYSLWLLTIFISMNDFYLIGKEMFFFF